MHDELHRRDVGDPHGHPRGRRGVQQLERVRDHVCDLAPVRGHNGPGAERERDVRAAAVYADRAGSGEWDGVGDFRPARDQLHQLGGDDERNVRGDLRWGDVRHADGRPRGRHGGWRLERIRDRLSRHGPLHGHNRPGAHRDCDIRAVVRADCPGRGRDGSGVLLAGGDQLHDQGRDDEWDVQGELHQRDVGDPGGHPRGGRGLQRLEWSVHRDRELCARHVGRPRRDGHVHRARWANRVGPDTEAIDSRCRRGRGDDSGREGRERQHDPEPDGHLR